MTSAAANTRPKRHTITAHCPGGAHWAGRGGGGCGGLRRRGGGALAGWGRLWAGRVGGVGAGGGGGGGGGWGGGGHGPFEIKILVFYVGIYGAKPGSREPMVRARTIG